MLKRILKENIDGEAIMWAYNRLKKEEEKNSYGNIRWCSCR